MRERLSFIDWMKATGMLLIVYGHAPGGALLPLTSPFNVKQLGVAFFVFVTGYSLAGERRPLGRVLYNRLFEVLVLGLACALLQSAWTWFARGDLAESNYVPFALGANVALNFFPANPTTWYIGTYMHILLFWAVVLRRLQIRPWMIAVAIVVEFLGRGALIQADLRFISYMLLTNWITVFLLGMWAGQRTLVVAPEWKASYIALAWLSFTAMWMAGTSRIHLDGRFPFETTASSSSAWTTSAMVSVLYATHAWFAFCLTCRLPAWSWIEFLAKSTLFVFIVHMPFVMGVTPWLYPLIPWPPLRAVVGIGLFFVIPALLSGPMRAVLNLPALRDWIWFRLYGENPLSKVAAE